ncbi:hypothetical protein X777_09294 [Ooceraea biroi]|uniref:Uncharacterized protein n=1 Tax=Ooceraea biroi TaxID=2015173 RepID=A0A026WAC3_OOCBI|nr:hypothetical protein X777_09294 [Ooceraea biroi]
MVLAHKLEDVPYYLQYYIKTHMRAPGNLIGVIAGAILYDHGRIKWRLSKFWSHILVVPLPLIVLGAFYLWSRKIFIPYEYLPNGQCKEDSRLFFNELRNETLWAVQNFDPKGTFWDAIEEQGNLYRIRRYFLQLALCVPSACSAEDVETVLKSSIEKINKNNNIEIQITAISTPMVPVLMILQAHKLEDVPYYLQYYIKTHMRAPGNLIGVIAGAILYDHGRIKWRLSKFWSHILVVPLPLIVLGAFYLWSRKIFIPYDMCIISFENSFIEVLIKIESPAIVFLSTADKASQSSFANDTSGFNPEAQIINIRNPCSL